MRPLEGAAQSVFSDGLAFVVWSPVEFQFSYCMVQFLTSGLLRF